MTTVQDILDAAAGEAAEVKARVDSLETEVQALKDQIANGTPVSEEQMQSMLTAVQGIFTPPA